MSAAASWSYTRTATLWALTGRDDWTGQKTYAAPVAFRCDYKATSQRMTDTNGNEFTSQQQIFTEYSTAKQGDMVLIGEHTAATSPVTAGAIEVRSVMRYSDTFNQAADDYMVAT